MSSPETYPAGELALPLPVDPFSLLLDEVMGGLGYEVLPQGFPPPIAGAAIWDDIWNAVQRLLSFPMNMLGWLWDHFLWIFNRIWDAWLWFWVNALEPKLRWLGNYVWDVANWFWAAGIQPFLQRVFDRVWEAANWFWSNATRPFLDSIWRLIDTWFRWLWDTALAPFLNSLSNRIWDVWNWFWGSLLQPSLHWVYDRVWDTANWFWAAGIQPFFQRVFDRVWEASQWVVNNIAMPALDWLKDHIASKFVELTVWTGDKFRDLGETVLNVTIQGAQAIGEGFESALRWLFEHVFDPFADAIRVKLSIPRKLLTGQYHDIEDLLTDIEDPFSAGSIAALLWAIPAATLALIPAMMEMGSLYFRRNIYNVARDVGATIPTFADLRDATSASLCPRPCMIPGSASPASPRRTSTSSSSSISTFQPPPTWCAWRSRRCSTRRSSPASARWRTSRPTSPSGGSRPGSPTSGPTPTGRHTGTSPRPSRASPCSTGTLSPRTT